MAELNVSRIVELRATNFKKLKAVRIRPDGSTVVLGGPNGAGKSSVLDAIQAALAGAAGIPPDPLRHGAEKGEVTLDLGDLVVKRTFTEAGTSLFVLSKDGARYDSPQKLLDGLIGQLTFDPLAFARMKPKEQFEELRRITGLDFKEVDAQRKKTFDERTMVTRELKALQARLAAAPEVEAPDEEISTLTLGRELQEALDFDRANQKTREQLVRASEHVGALRSQLAAIEAAIEETKSKISEAATTEAQIKSVVAALKEPNIAGLKNTLGTAEQTNRLVRAKKERAALAGAVTKKAEEVEGLTSTLSLLDHEKDEALKKVALPVAGLGLDLENERVTFAGVPLEQASQGETLRISVALALATNPRLKIPLVRDGSHLDETNLALLASMAEAAGAQVWIERVGKGEEVKVVIEDGEVSEVRGPKS